MSQPKPSSFSPGARTLRPVVSIAAKWFLVLLVALFAAGCGGAATEPSLTGDAAPDAAPDDHSDDSEYDDSEHDDTEHSDDSASNDSADNDSASTDSEGLRIVSLSPTATEILFAIGAGDQVVAVDSFSNYPAEAPVTDLSAFEPNLEAIAEYEPNLVVLSYDPVELIPALDSIGVATAMQIGAVTIQDTYDQITQLGELTGHEAEAADLIAAVQAELDAVVASAPPEVAGMRVYHELDDTFYSVSSATFIGQMYQLLGLENVADIADAEQEAYGYPQLSVEYLLEADPQLIVITDLVGYTADDVAARPGWDTVSAVADGRIVAVNADIASRWGPRVPEFLASIVGALSE